MCIIYFQVYSYSSEMFQISMVMFLLETFDKTGNQKACKAAFSRCYIFPVERMNLGLFGKRILELVLLFR
jgi:hypothetical protein